MRTWPALLLSLVAACEPPVVPARTPIIVIDEGEPTNAAPAPSSGDSSRVNAATAERTAAPWTPGASVVARGRVATTPWQHVTAVVPGKFAEYFDLEGGQSQAVIYWSQAPSCPGLVEVAGTVFEVGAEPKRPSGAPSNADEGWSELQLDVASARCVE